MPEIPSGAKTPRQVLINWANAQQNWVRAIVGELLSTGLPLSSDSIDAAYQMSLAERGLADVATVPTVAKLVLQTGEADATERLVLGSLEDVEGVNTLAPKQEIKFHPRMTVLFGENAAGKSGYVRILKRIAAVRAAEPVIPNVRTAKKATPHAIVRYRLGSAETAIDWNNEAGVAPLTRMCVFDTRAMVFHVDPDLDYVYTPRDLALFPLVAESIQGVRDRLSADIEARKPTTKSLLGFFDPGARLYGMLETLGPSTDLAELQSLAEVSDEGLAKLGALQETVSALAPGTVDNQTRLVQNDRSLFAKIQATAAVFAGFDFDRFNGWVSRLQEARALHRGVTTEAFRDSQVPGLLSEPWRAFILAADQYLKSIGQDHVPGHSDRCAYCRQELSGAARELVTKYHDYCNNLAQRQIDALDEELRSICSTTDSIDVTGIRTVLSMRLGAMSENAVRPPVLVKGFELMTSLGDVQKDLRARTLVDGVNVKALAADVTRLSDAAIADADRLLADLATRGQEREAAHNKAAQELVDLQARINLAKYLPQVQDFVRQAKWCSRAEAALGRFQGLQRSLTEASKEASEDLLNRDFSHHFQRECAELRAPSVTLEFPGRGGHAKRKKVITASHKLSDILSEGEQKVIALADFLSEAAIRTNSAPIVFDDPVNSLDYKRLEYIVDRLVALSAEHQVVVFTHNIWFAMAVLTKFEKMPESCAYYDVSKGEGGVTGFVTGGRHPRYDTPKTLRGMINELIQSAAAASGETQQALIERAYSRLRSWCEAVVEQELLAGVAQRYQPNIMMGRLAQIKPDRLSEAIEAISVVFDKCCRITDAHSQPLETLNVRPSLEELRKEWMGAQATRDRYLAQGG